MPFKNPFFSPPRLLAKKKSGFSLGFSLIEIILALMILTLILAISIPSLVSYFTEQRLRSSIGQFESILQQARHLAMSTGHTHRLHFTDKSIELYDGTIPEKEKPEPIITEPFIPGIKLREKIEESPVRYILPEDWTISNQGLCDPLRFRFTLDHSWMEFSVHPLDGALLNLEFRLEENAK